MVRAGLRISEALALKVGDVELGPRSGTLLVRTGKGLKERKLALSSEARAALKAYLQVWPEANGDLLILSRTYRALDPRDVQRMVSEAARRAGIKFTVTRTHCVTASRRASWPRTRATSPRWQRSWGSRHQHNHALSASECQTGTGDGRGDVIGRPMLGTGV
jgi:integrase